MNFTIIIGWVMAWALVVYGMLDGGTLGMFVNPPSIAITIGGTIGVLIASFPFSTLKQLPKYLMIAIKPPKFNPQEYIKQITEFATIARSKGLLALEDSANKCQDPFLKQALMYIVDANDPDKVRQMLEDSIDYTCERHGIAWSFCERGMALGPAFGMIGTLVGLVIMLNQMGTNPDGLGPAMAVALITTFYGSLLANVVFMPLHTTLKNIHDEEITCMQLIVDGVLSIAAGSNPRLIQEKLEFMLPKYQTGKKEK